jgi:excisionase family DNA binding protein
MSPEDSGALLTIRELADWLNVAPQTIHGWRYKGEPSPRALKLGNRLRFRRDDVEAWIAEQSEQPMHSGRPPAGRADGR